MGAFSYDGKPVIPAPLVNIKEIYDLADDGSVIGTRYSVVADGTLVAWMGSPTSSGTFWGSTGYPPDEVPDVNTGLASLLTKQEALQALFSRQGRTLTIQPWDGSTPLTLNPRVLDVDFPKGQWVQTCPYTITMDCDVIHGLITTNSGDPVNYKISKATNDWTIEVQDEKLKTYRLTHNVSAVGKTVYDTSGNTVPAWQKAQDWVMGKVGLGLNPARMVASGVINGSGLQAYNYLRNQTVNELGGVFSVTENWLCYEPTDGIAAYDEGEVSTRFSAMENRTTVTVQGTITGLEVRDNVTRDLVTTRYQNAQSKWAIVQPGILGRANADAGATLNQNLLASTVGRNSVAGTITYSYEYDTRPTPPISGALSYLMTVDDDNAADVFAKFTVPGRGSAGPIYQDLSTKTGKVRTVTVEVKMPAMSQDYTPPRPDVTSQVLAQKPSGAWVGKDRETWAVQDGRYSRNTEYVW